MDTSLGACEVTLLSAGGESEQGRAGPGTSPAGFAKVVPLQRSSEKGREAGLFVGGRRSLLPSCPVLTHCTHGPDFVQLFV